MAVDNAGAVHLVYFPNGDTGATRWVARLPDGTYINPLTGQPWPVGTNQIAHYNTQTGPLVSENLMGMVRPSIAFDAARHAYFAYETTWAGPIAVRKFAYQDNNTWAPVGQPVLLPQPAGCSNQPACLPVGYNPMIHCGPAGNLAVAWAGGHNGAGTSFPHKISVCPGGNYLGPWTTLASWDFSNAIALDQAGNLHVLGSFSVAGDYWYRKYTPSLQPLSAALRITDTNGGYRIFSPSISVTTDTAYMGFQIADNYRNKLDCWLWTVAGGTTVSGPVNASATPAGWGATGCSVSARNGRVAVTYLTGVQGDNYAVYAWSVITNTRTAAGLDPGIRTTNQLGIIDGSGTVFLNARVNHAYDFNANIWMGGVRVGVLPAAPTGPIISLSRQVIDHTIWIGSSPANDSISVTNIGAGVLNYTVSDNVGWVAASPSAGSSSIASDSFDLLYNLAGLLPGSHTATVTVSSPQAANSPVSITINLTILTARSDFDRDGDVDQMDFGHFQQCLTGPTIAQNQPQCLDSRLDDDNDVDQNDFGLFQQCLRGPGIPPPINCDGG